MAVEQMKERTDAHTHNRREQVNVQRYSCHVIKHFLSFQQVRKVQLRHRAVQERIDVFSKPSHVMVDR